MFRWLRSLRAWDAESAKQHILSGNAKPGMRVVGTLDLSRQTVLPLPDDLRVEELQLNDCVQLRRLPRRLFCLNLSMQRSAIEALPEDLQCFGLLDARDCRALREVATLTAERIDLSGCVRLESVPAGLEARNIDLGGCYRLRELPEGFGATTRELSLRDCTLLDHLPEGMRHLVSLDLRGCRSLTVLPEGIRVRSWIDVANTGLTDLPWSLRSVRVLWNGVQISDRVAFDPESITVEEIMREQNASVRSVLLERVGADWFVDHAEATLIDEDEDPGGRRRLLRVPFFEKEDYFFVELHCPSTGHRYMLRVPPDVKTCQQAVAWTAGYSSPAAYRPIEET